MKRQLGKDEKEITENSVERIQEEISDLQVNLEYNKSLKAKEQYLRDFDDEWRTYLRKRKDREDNKILDQMQDLIDSKLNTLEISRKQLKEGVEVIKLEEKQDEN